MECKTTKKFTFRNQAARRLNRVIKDISNVLSGFLGQFNAIWTVTFDAFNQYFNSADQAALLLFVEQYEFNLNINRYMNENWQAEVFQKFEIEFVSYYWVHNRSLIVSRTHDPLNETLIDTIPYPASLSTLPTFNNADFTSTSTRTAGFLVENDRNVTYLVVTVPVQDDGFNGPVKAVALVGKRITDKVMKDISNRAQYCTTIYHSNFRTNWNPLGVLTKARGSIQPNVTDDKWEDQNIGFIDIMKPTATSSSQLSARFCWQGTSQDSLTLSEERLSGYNVYQDIFGKKTVIFRIDLSRGINTLAYYSIIIVLSILASVGVGFFILIGCLLELFVLFRVSSLTSQIRKIKESVDLTKRVGVLKGVDEVDFLTTNINEMLTNVEDTQNQLKEILNKLGHEEEKTRLMLNSIPDSIAIVNSKNGQINEVNSTFEKFLNQDWKKTPIFQILPDLDRNAYSNATGNCYESTAINSSGTKIPCQVTTSVIEFFEHGVTIPYVMVIIKDMRERNDTLNKLEMGMQEYSKMENQFAFEQQFRDPIIREAFTNFCKKEDTVENVNFLLFVEEYKKLDQASRSNNQKLIFDKYLSGKAKLSLNISSQAKDAAKKKITSGLGQIDLFSELEKEVKSFLIENSFKQFQNEKLKYIDDVLKERETRPKKVHTGWNRLSETYNDAGLLSFIPNDPSIKELRKSSKPVSSKALLKKDSMDDDFDLSNYIITYDTIFKYKDIGDAFYELLKDEVNPEPWEFLQDVEKYENTKSLKDKIKLMKEIYSQYISESGSKQLNFSASTKNSFIEKIEPQLKVDDSWCLDDPIDTIFDEIKRIIRAEMIVDVFPRFTKSEFCLKVLEKYKNDPKVLLPKIAMKHSYNNDFVLDGIILDEHIEYFKRAAEDTFDYEILSWNSSYLITTFFATHNYIPKVTLVDNTAVYKYDAIVPYPLEHVVCSLAPLNNKLKYDSDYKYVHEIDFNTYEQYNQAIEKKYGVGLASRRGVAIVESDIVFKDDSSRNLKYPAVYTVGYDDSNESYYVFSRPILLGEFNLNDQSDEEWKNKVAELRNPKNGKMTKYSPYFAISLHIYKSQGEGKTRIQQFNGKLMYIV